MTKLSFCQNDPPRSTSFWQKNSLVTHTFFDLCLLRHLAQLQILVTTLYYTLLIVSFDLSPSGLPPKTQYVIYGRPPLVSSLGLVHSTPFASLAMTSVHAKRARSNYSKARTVSDHTNNPNEVITIY